MPSKKKKVEVFYRVDINKPKDETLREIVKLVCPKPEGCPHPPKIVDNTNKAGYVSSIVVDNSISFVLVQGSTSMCHGAKNVDYSTKGVKVEDCFVYNTHKTIGFTPDLRISISRLQAAVVYIKKLLPQLEERRREIDAIQQKQKDVELAKTKWIRDATSGVDEKLGDYVRERYISDPVNTRMLLATFVLTPEQTRKVVDFVISLRKEIAKGGDSDDREVRNP